MKFPQPLPSGDGDGARIARNLAVLLGPAYQPADGTAIADDLQALGGAIADARAAGTRAVDEAFTDSATDLLTPYEERLGAPSPTSSNPERRARLTVQRRASGAGTPDRFLAAVRAAAAEAALYENTCTAVAATDPRGVFRFAITIPAGTWSSPSKLAAVRGAAERAKPAHTRCTVGTRVGFRLDDPESLLDRDLFGS